jgi:hypothetical protein
VGRRPARTALLPSLQLLQQPFPQHLVGARLIHLPILLQSRDHTLGYAANIFRQPGEDHGAIFFSMRFRDLFR